MPVDMSMDPSMDDAGIARDGGALDSSVPPDATAGDDRDSAIQHEPDASPLCLADVDQDGFGVEGVTGACREVDGGLVTVLPGDCDDQDEHRHPGAPIDRCDGKDNDCDLVDEAPTVEVCNGVDDDCQNGVDDGVSNACGLCGELPAETCNWVDDDCDGVVDANLSAKVGEQVVTQAGSETDAIQLTMVERAAGGAWLLYNTIPTADFGLPSKTAGGMLRARRISSDGKVAAGPAIDLAPDANGFAADSDGKWVVVLYRKMPSAMVDPANREALRLRLFLAEDMSFMSEHRILPEVDDCGVEAHDVAVLEDAIGKVRVAGVFGMQTGCASKKTYFAAYSFEGPWGGGSKQELPGFYAGKVERVPCRDEWLLYYPSSDGLVLRRYTAAGSVVNSVDIEDKNSNYPVSLQRGEATCASGSASMLLTTVNYNESGDWPQLRAWQVDTATGTFKRAGSDVYIRESTRRAVRTHQSGGRWFASGGFVDDKPHLYEVTFDATEPLRDIALLSVPGAYTGNVWDSSGGLLNTGEAIVSVFASKAANLASFRDPGDTNPPIAVTYGVGCP